MDLKDLYRDVIVDHNRHPRNFRARPYARAQAEGFNPPVLTEVESHGESHFLL